MGTKFNNQGEDENDLTTFDFEGAEEFLNEYNYKYDKDKNLLDLIDKKSSLSTLATFTDDDVDMGLKNKETMDLLEFFSLELPSKLKNEEMSKALDNLKTAKEEVNKYKENLSQIADFKNMGGKI